MELNDLVYDDDLRKLSKEKLLEYCDKLNVFAKDTLLDGNAYMYYALNKQMKDLSRQIAELKIDIQSEEDMDLFDNVLKLAIQADKISDGLEKVKGRIKTDQTGHIKDAIEGSAEWYAMTKGKAK